MKLPVFALFAPLAIYCAPCAAQDDVAGQYYLTGVHDAAGQLWLHDDGRFEYVLAYGALDERATGSWVRHGNMLTLTTEPRPVPPVFRLESQVQQTGDQPTVLVTWPDGTGIPGVDFCIGFDGGESYSAYTRRDGWHLSPDESRRPIWIELIEPIHGIVSKRFEIDQAPPVAMHFVLIPNDIGVVDFGGMTVSVGDGEIVIHRGNDTMRFVRAREGL